MKKNHQYFFQVQHQMLVTNTKYCDFFVWTQGNDTFLLRVSRDNLFCKQLLDKLLSIFNRAVLPELVSRKHQPAKDHEQKMYCSCDRPAFPPMISCANNLCKIEKYHYSCMNIKRAPKKWFFPSCIKK